MAVYINTPFTTDDAKRIKAGDTVYISGTIYTARDAAHKRLCELVAQGKELPFDVKDAVIYYVGPTPPKPGMAIGSAGPTTSYRMDAYAPTLMDLGLRGMIGKGKRSVEVVESIKKNGAVYFAAIGGAGALLSSCIKEAEVIAYEDLGAEAVRKLRVENLPVVAVIDTEGTNLYETGRKAYLESQK
ncbi:MAG: Fe-S-containing hydro-lyase [Clostridia bacterium]|nr:Fe-S-containing hydro-lyase [Clostridia bacterium]